jgi:hypothetical protein
MAQKLKNVFSALQHLKWYFFQLGSDSCVVKADAMNAALDANALKACKEVTLEFIFSLLLK